MNNKRPEDQGMYRSDFEHDNCGIGFVAHLKGKKSHKIIQMGLEVLENMTHRGAEGADSNSGDGAGVLLQIPRDFYLIQGFGLPPEGQFGTGIIFLPTDEQEAEKCLTIVTDLVKSEGIELIGFRDVPRDNSSLGDVAKAAEPYMKQILLGADLPQEELERKLYIIRKKAEKIIRNTELKQKDIFYIVSLSSKILIYKGMLTSGQLREYYLDLQDIRFHSGIALVHSRFSTNTFPSWDLAQPFRMLAHNGEINTIKGNRLWMEARESILKSEKLGDLRELYPIIEPNKSDSASLDNVLEFLYMSGKSLPHALSMLIPESWNTKNPIPPALRAFYEYHSTFMEPWDGPASLLISDGRYIGGTLDRNGLRPSRYVITNTDLIIMGSEVGVQTCDPGEIIQKGRLKPGKMMLVDTKKGTILYDKELKKALSEKYPYQEWIEKNMVTLDEIKSGQDIKPGMEEKHELYLRAFNYTREDISSTIMPMAEGAKEPIGSMGNDTPLAVLSERPQRLFNYFKQLFAQVTNPPIDPIREELVMSLTGYIGSLQKNILNENPDHVKMIKFKTPLISNTSFQVVKNLSYKGFSNRVIPIIFHVSNKEENLEASLNRICIEAAEAVDAGVDYIILSDRDINEDYAPIPSLLAVSAVHHYLISKRKRMQIDLVVETAEAREVHHFALLFGYGASVVNPYLVFSVIEKLVREKTIQQDFQKAEQNYIKAVNQALLKILSKMGISTLRSYRSAQIFEAVGISKEVIDKYFRGTVSRIGGLNLDEIAREVLKPHSEAFIERTLDKRLFSGVYTYRKFGEHHAWNPETISLLQWSTKSNDYQKYKEFSSLVQKDNQRPSFLRGFFDFKRNPIDVSEVEPVSEITKRFVTGAMSYGSISSEAHETLAIAMNRLGGRSNTGEGGEDPARFLKRKDGSSARSAIKQVASGRFGVTANYLVNADEIQIKVAQGAKPGEGGQLPGHKVSKIIAKTRYSMPGITLISPPPHHDIYSIEDLAQLIFDLKNVNPKAVISVKLVSETGVGTIAAGVAKAKADLIIISGAEGGTGASPSSSIKHAGLPTEMGLAETQQTLVLNNLRKNVVLQTDGQLKNGYDVVSTALLGAEEFGFATSALIVMGCVMMRKCHLNTCPVGVATQDEALRKKFRGQADYLVSYFTFIAQEVREIMAEMGIRTFNELVGRSDLLIQKSDVKSAKTSGIDLKDLILKQIDPAGNPLFKTIEQDHKIDDVLDLKLIAQSKAAIDKLENTTISSHIINTDRAVGAMLSGAVSTKYGFDGLPENTINCNFRGSAGQSFGAFLAKGITFKLEGDSNDYMGKGLSGGRIVVVPDRKSGFAPEENIIIGNTVLYGATRGEIYINGVAGERFCVRNSGATAVVEGVGDHCCEYMTGGRTVVLGPTGRNFAAGMSGGIAYVLNSEGDFDYYCNMGMVDLSLVEDRRDVKELEALIEKHVQHTDSPVGKRILEDWENYIDKFIKVIPYEYKKVMEEEKLDALKKKIEAMEVDVEHSKFENI